MSIKNIICSLAVILPLFSCTAPSSYNTSVYNTSGYNNVFTNNKINSRPGFNGVAMVAKSNDPVFTYTNGLAKKTSNKWRGREG